MSHTGRTRIALTTLPAYTLTTLYGMIEATSSPHLTREAIYAALAFAADTLRAEGFVVDYAM